MAKFHDRLKLLRRESGLSQQDFANLIGISKSSINMYERGEREPGLETLESIADYFNVDMDYLLGKSQHRNKAAWLEEQIRTSQNNSVERVKAICKERKIPISRLESDLGFSNGYIGQLKKGVFPSDRLSKIAEYLDVTMDYLLTGQEKTAPANGDGRSEAEQELIRLIPLVPEDIQAGILAQIKTVLAQRGLLPEQSEQPPAGLR